MASLDQVVQQIRFSLEQLRVKNAHHEFEHLCRHYARARICSNILPATGPVSAGGDQARDFETFRTYLAQSPIADTTFAGRVADEPVAFACTRQSKKVEAKIQDDVHTILASGSKVLGVHYFCVADVPVARRHQLQAWARENHSLELEIHDGQALAENLAQKDVFWIAERYLATLPRLRGNEEFRNTVQRLRERGWRDWHITEALLTTVVNFRVHENYGPRGDIPTDFLENFTKTPEHAGLPEIPATEFTEEHLDLSRRVNMAAILKTWGLQLHHPRLVTEVIERFLATRYGYWTDDVDHPDPFVIQPDVSQ